VTVLKAVQPDRQKKMKTFPIWEPNQSKVSDEQRHLEQAKGILQLMKNNISR
jgi:hypothetical protein